jgi:hypothetical protein
MYCTWSFYTLVSLSYHVEIQIMLVIVIILFIGMHFVMSMPFILNLLKVHIKFQIDLILRISFILYGLMIPYAF